MTSAEAGGMPLWEAPDHGPVLGLKRASAHTGDPSFSCKAAMRVCQKGLLRRNQREWNGPSPRCLRFQQQLDR